MTNKIVLFGVLILLVFGWVQNKEILPDTSSAVHESMMKDVLGEDAMKCTSFVSVSSKDGDRENSSYRSESDGTQCFETILQLRNDYHERTSVLKLFKINPACIQLRLQSAQFARSHCMLPELDYHSSKFACNYYLYTLRQILI